MAKLNPRQQAFVREYLVDLNATQAYVRAGYNPKHADVDGPRLLRNAGVRTAVDAGIAKLEKKTGIDAEWVRIRLARIADADMAEAFQDDGTLKAPKDIPADTRFALSDLNISELEVASGKGVMRTMRAKFWDKPKALELLGRSLGMFTDKVEHSGAVTVSFEFSRSAGPPGGPRLPPTGAARAEDGE